MEKLIILLTFISLSVQVEHCHTEDKICKECKEGYHLIQNKYCSKIEHCVETNENTCSFCEDGYSFNPESSKCEILNNHCTNYNSEDPTKCQSCQNGYILNSEETGCVEITSHCIYSYDNSKCAYCEDGYAINQKLNKCVEFEGCEEVNDDSTKCIICSNDFYQPNENG